MKMIFNPDNSLTLFGYAKLQQTAIAYCKEKRYPPWRFGGLDGHDNSESGNATWRHGFALALTEYLSAKIWVHRLQSGVEDSSETFVLYLSEGEAQASQNRSRKPRRHIYTLKVVDDDSPKDKYWHRQPIAPITLAELMASQAGMEELLNRLDEHSVAPYSAADWHAMQSTFGSGVEMVWTDMNDGGPHFLALACVPNPEGTRSVLLPSCWGVEPDDQSGWGSFGKDLSVDPNLIFAVFDAKHRFRFVKLTTPWQPPGGAAPMAQATWCGSHSYAYLDTIHSAIGLYEASVDPLVVDGQGDWVCDIVTQGGRQVNDAAHKVLVDTMDLRGCVVKCAGADTPRLLGWLPLKYRDFEDLGGIEQCVNVRWKDILGNSERRMPVQDPDTLLWGWIDDQGDIAIAPRFTSVEHFQRGMAQASRAQTPELWGLVNRSGDWLLSPTWSLLTWSSPRLVIVKNALDEWGALVLNLDAEGQLKDEPKVTVPLESAQFWLDAYASVSEEDEHPRDRPRELCNLSREEMITLAIERVQHERASRAVQLAMSEASLTRVAGLFDDSTTTRDLMAAGIWFASVRVLREQDIGIRIHAGETGNIYTQYPVGLSVFNLSHEAPVQGLQSMPNGVKGIPWVDLCVEPSKKSIKP